MLRDDVTIYMMTSQYCLLTSLPVVPTCIEEVDEEHPAHPVLLIVGLLAIYH